MFPELFKADYQIKISMFKYSVVVDMVNLVMQIHGFFDLQGTVLLGQSLLTGWLAGKQKSISVQNF